MWKENKKSLSRTFAFRDFVEAFAFVNKVGLIASRHQHYPKITINADHVEVTLSTDKIGGFVTQKDHEMAEEIDIAFGKEELLRQSA
jgi:4a-hydroxytetrahydrobiopterin dehydratase